MADDEPTLAFETLTDPPGVEIIDRLERRRDKFHTSEAVTPSAANPDSFAFPVDRAFEISTSEIVIPIVVPILVRTWDGEIVAEVGHLDQASLQPGEYILDLSPQIKTYMEVDSAVHINGGLNEMRIEFGGITPIRVGVRSKHDRPASTITTTDDPLDMMAAVSSFGSALKTTGPERAFPAHRGHPPAVELGESLEIPSQLEEGDTGIKLEIPPRYGMIYAASSLAYYLCAEVVPGPTPRLKTDSGFEYSLQSPKGYESKVEQTLKQVFVLDCITRTEGIYNIDTHERSKIEPYVDLDFGQLYEQPLQEQVESYLEIPFNILEDFVPEWRLTTHVEPVPETIKQIPFVVDDLAIIRVSQAGTVQQPSAQPALQDFSRDEVITRSAEDTSTASQDDFVEPVASDALEQAWIGENIPIGASKLTADAFENRLNRETTDGDISITVILNDSRMADERDLVDQVYGSREDLPFEVNIHREVTVKELRELLTQKSEFLHYIGHTERDGFECLDGKLDVTGLEETGVDAFLLNACNSYHQGLGLIESGAIGGIVTLNEIINNSAIRIGESIARLLNAGFPLRAALTIAREESVFGGQYIVVGDGGMAMTQAASRTPNLLDVTDLEDGYEMEIQTYATDDAGLGSVFMPYLSEIDEYYLSSGSIGSFTVSKEELSRFFKLEEVPVRMEGELCWSSDIDID